MDMNEEKPSKNNLHLRFKPKLTKFCKIKTSLFIIGQKLKNTFKQSLLKNPFM